MPRYHVDNRFTLTQQNLSSSFKSMVAVYNSSAGTLLRGRVVGLSIGADGTPSASDCAIVYALTRYSTTLGTGNSVTPEKIDNGDAAARLLAKINFTVEPSISSTALTWSRALNQRASMQWNAPDIDAAPKWGAVADAGIVLAALSPTYTTTVHCGMDTEE